jgi:4-hydroxythreonine-4-phosphate dehydrogenase
MLPAIGITLGDPGGIGPEVALKALSHIHQLPAARYILFGPGRFIRTEIERYRLDLSLPDFQEGRNVPPPRLSVFDLSPVFELQQRGRSHPKNGDLSFTCFQYAVNMAQSGKIHAVVTAPISKESWQTAGIEYPGHTAYLNQQYPHAIMSFFSSRLNVALFTHHVPLKTALGKVKKKELTEFLKNLQQSTQKIGRFQFVLAGLNPHAGESGMLGREEIEEIIPAVESAKKAGMDISGPFPPDTVCLKALDQENTIVISLYHDQGLVAFKLIAFDTGVNVTLGLPFIRTSPDHGTAFDIAGTGRADPGSMMESIRLAADFAARII